MTTIIEDKANKEGLHEIKHRYFIRNGIELIRYPLPVGDYIIADEKVKDVIKRKQDRNIEIKKMDFLGSYKTTVDTKKDIQELVGDICGKAHARFRDECILAQNNQIKLVILVENNDGISDVRELFQWRNPRLNIWKNSDIIIGLYNNGKPRYKKVQKYPNATTGKVLAKACLTMNLKYGVEFRFCKPEESAKEVIKILCDGG